MAHCLLFKCHTGDKYQQEHQLSPPKKLKHNPWKQVYGLITSAFFCQSTMATGCVRVDRRCFGRDLRGVSASSGCGLVRRDLFIEQAERLDAGTAAIGHHLDLRFTPTAIQQRLHGGPRHTLIAAVTHQMHQRVHRL